MHLRSIANRVAILFFTAVTLHSLSAWAQKSAQIREETRELITYPFGDPNPVAIHSKSEKIYPYFLFEGYTAQPRPQKWKVVTLENDYIQVYVLPESGGKVWGAIEKSTGKEFVYRNEVIKFRNVAMRGPWTSGGIEFNFGLIGHHPSTATPVDFTTRTNDDGSVSCFVGNLDLPSRTRWSVEIRLPKDKAYFETHAQWSNPTSLNQSYYNWMTAAAVVTNDLEFYYPGNTSLDHDGTPASWPISASGRNIAKYKENNFGSHKSYHTVGEYNDFMAGYYHTSKFGFGHWALYDEMPGHKLWLWALSRNGGIWEDLLTDTDGQYMEYQAGRLFDQYSPSSTTKSSLTQTPFTPHVTDRWTEIWFPFKDIGGVKDVSPYGAMNVTRKGETVEIAINALSSVNAELLVTVDGKVVHTEKKTLKPMDVITTIVQVPASASYEVQVKGMELMYASENKNILYRPFMAIPRAKQPAGDELYREAVELKEYREYASAKELFQQCLQEDSLHLEALAHLAELYVRNTQYDSALLLTRKVLRHDTYHPLANYVAGVAYKTIGDAVNALECFGWAARSMEYRSAAYAEMAAVKLSQQDVSSAVHYANLSLDFNRYNVAAQHILTVAYRLGGQHDKASVVRQAALSGDPLDHFQQYEKYLAAPGTEAWNTFTKSITNESPFQTYLELALEYEHYGQREQAIEVLKKSPQHVLVSLWLAWLTSDEAALPAIVSASPAFVFPYRVESLKPLAWATQHNSSWKFKYYVALNYLAVQQRDKAVSIIKALGQQPDYAPFYLTRARLLPNDTQTLNDLLYAKKLAPREWRTWSDLIDYYERMHQYKEALAVSTPAVKQFKTDYTIGLQHAKALLYTGKYKESVEVLEKINILPFEGSDQGHSVYENVLLSLATELIKSKKYKDALARIDQSREWPEHLGVGKPYDPDTRLQDYLAAGIYTAMNNKAAADDMQKKVMAYADQETSFAGYNDWLTWLALRNAGNASKADQLLARIRAQKTATLPQRWVVAMASQDAAALKAMEKETADNPRINLLKRIEQATH